MPEVTDISPAGFLLRMDREELFLSFEQFPWFANAPADAVLHVERPSAGHLYWPELDIDLSVESIRHPERFPLVARSSA
jgi:Protein of unknown function (DUF2442)